MLIFLKKKIKNLGLVKYLQKVLEITTLCETFPFEFHMLLIQYIETKCLYLLF